MSHFFVSDVHLRAPDDERTHAFLNFIRTRVTGAQTFYLVGDIFDVWFGYQSVLYQSYFPVIRALADLADTGTRVVLFSGNHDPDLGPFFAQLGIETHPNALMERIGDYTVRLEHGDTVDPRGWSNLLLCKTVRNPIVQTLVRAVHPSFIWRAAKLYNRNRSHPEYGDSLDQRLFDDYFPARVAEGIDVLIMGHYHRAVCHHRVFAGRRASYYVLGDWIRHRTYLQFDGSFKLRHFDGMADPVLPEGDHPPMNEAKPKR